MFAKFNFRLVFCIDLESLELGNTTCRYISRYVRTSIHIGLSQCVGVKKKRRDKRQGGRKRERKGEREREREGKREEEKERRREDG